MTKFLNISTDGTLSGNSDSTVVSEKVIKTYADTKQATISDLATIRSGAALGATAVQPGDLAAVATSGSYTDLSNKPTIPSVGNGTITITQGGVSKGTFTTNQSGNTTIALDAGAGSPVWGSIGGTLSDQTDLQNALDAKQATITGAATTIASSDLTANRAVISNGSGKVATSATTSTELGYLSGVTSAVQTQLDSKANSADVYTKSDVDTALSNKANIALDNLTSTGANIANWSSNVTNCITNIPQDIKLELSNGTLTLKAGSKVYVPNGAGVFDEVVVATDKTFSNTGGTGQYIIMYNVAGSVGSAVYPSDSGTSTPAASTSYKLFYNISDNKIYFDTGIWNSGYAFPIALVSSTNGVITSIDQVFNGFGYIGSTVFALPGVKGLAPKGRNADGTLKSVVIAINSVITRTFAATGALYIGLQATGFGGITKSNYSYDPDTNIQYSSGTAFSNSIVFASCDMSSGVISNWTVLKNNPFHALDYSDTEYIAHQAMPSDRYVDLTRGSTSPIAITAPADGYIVFEQEASAAYSLIRASNASSSAYDYVFAGNVGVYFGLTVPVSKGTTTQLYFTPADTVIRFRFIYANGAK